MSTCDLPEKVSFPVTGESFRDVGLFAGDSGRRSLTEEFRPFVIVLCRRLPGELLVYQGY